jgi:hypothetical protein
MNKWLKYSYSIGEGFEGIQVINFGHNWVVHVGDIDAWDFAY